MKETSPIEAAAPLLEARDLTVSYGGGAGAIRAVEDVSLAIREGEIHALVGESGCGKSTLAYSLLGLVPPPGRITAGDVRFRGRSQREMGRNELRAMRAAEISIVFQAAMNSFNPVISVGRQVEHTLDSHPGVFASRAEGREYFEELLVQLRLPPARIWDTFESQLSGGMKQRTAIALALLLKPAVLILDEPTTALDVLNQRLVIEILQSVHANLGVTIIFVTHDLAVVAELAESVAVMYSGRLVEVGTVDEVFAASRRHPYVQALIEAIPSVMDQGLYVHPIRGSVPDLAHLPAGCRFAPRCPLAREECRVSEPRLVFDGNGHGVACHVVNDALLESEGSQA